MSSIVPPPPNSFVIGTAVINTHIAAICRSSSSTNKISPSPAKKQHVAHVAPCCYKQQQVAVATDFIIKKKCYRAFTKKVSICVLPSSRWQTPKLPRAVASPSVEHCLLGHRLAPPKKNPKVNSTVFLNVTPRRSPCSTA